MDKQLLLNKIADECLFRGSISKHTLGLVLREIGETHDYRPSYYIRREMLKQLKCDDDLSKHQVRECWCGLPFNSACHLPDQKLPEVNPK